MSSTVRMAPCGRARLAVLGAVTCLVLSTGAAGQTITVSTAQGATASLGQSFDLPITVDMRAYGGLLGSFSMTLRWDPATLTFVGGAPGSFGDVTVNEDSLLTGALFMAGANPAGVGGLVTIGTARFRPTVLDTTTLTLSVSEMYEAGSFTNLLPFVNVVNRQFCPGRGRYGDINGDGQSNSADALVALNHAVGLSTAGFDISLGDVDADGDIDPRDALVMLSSGAGLNVSQFRIGTLAPGAACAGAGGVISGITPDTVTVLVGQSVEFSVLRLDSAGIPVAGTNVSFTSTDSTVAVVDSGGVMTALAPGTVTISAKEDSAVTASAAVTVMQGRTLHWVDPLAFNEVNQLGTPAWPYADVATANIWATPGDTIMLRPGKYPENIIINQPLVLMGDTASGPAPLITANTTFSTGISITTSGNVELHHLQIDTLYTGIDVNLVDTLLIRDVSFLSNPNDFASLYVDSASAVRIQRTNFFGDVLNQGFGGNSGIYVQGHVGLLAADSITIANYGDYGMELRQLDSLDVRRSVIRSNYYYGIWYSWGDSTRTMAAVLEGNRITQHVGGSFYMRVLRSAYLRNNIFEGSNSTGNYMEGFSGAQVSILGDSIFSNPNLSQSQAYEFYHVDSVMVDSVVAIGRAGRIVVQDVRAAVVRNSSFFAGQYSYAVEAYAYAGGVFPTHDVSVRNVLVEGPDSTVCAQCGYGIYASDVTLDVDSLTVSKMSQGIYVVDSSATIKNYTVNDFSTALLTSCARVSVDGMTAVSGYEAFDFNGGCKSGDTVTVDNTSVDSVTLAIVSNDVPLIVTNSAFTNILSYGIQHYDTALVVTDNYFEMPSNSYALYVSMNGDSARSVVARNRIDCTSPTGSPVGMYLYNGSYLVENDSIFGCAYSVYASVSTAAVQDVDIRTNYIAARSPSSYGIYAAGNYGRYAIVGNTVMGAAPLGPDYAISVEAGGGRFSRVDSNLVDRFRFAGIWGGRVDTLLIRDNTVLNQVAGTGNASGVAGAAGIVQGVSTAADHVVEIRRNRIANSGRSGIMLHRDNTVDSVVVLVDSNTVKVAAEYGIAVQNYTNARLQYNAIDGAGLDAISLTRQDSSIVFRDTVWINDNNLTNSGRYGIQNARPTDFILAANNWWNDPLGPSGFYGDPGSTGDSVSVDVVWAPARSSPATAPVPTAPPAFFTVTADRISTPRLVGSGAAGGVGAAMTPLAVPTPLRRSVRVVPGQGLTEPLAPRPRNAHPQAPAWFQEVLRHDAERAAALQREYQRDLAELQRRVERLRLRQDRDGGRP